jgi:hypothetical protein
MDYPINVLTDDKKRRRSQEEAVICAAMAMGHAIYAMGQRADYPEGALTSALIYMNDALQLAVLRGLRIADKGADIQPVGKEGDLTSLIGAARNAACHMGSKRHIADAHDNYFRFMMLMGKCIAVQINTLKIENPYDDDVAIYFGNTRIFLRRNLQLALTRLQSQVNVDAERLWNGVIQQRQASERPLSD